MNIIPPAAPVRYGPDFALHGEVNTVSIGRGDRVQYEVLYWQNGEAKTVWLHESQVRQDGGQPCRIGFAVGVTT